MDQKGYSSKYFGGLGKTKTPCSSDGPASPKLSSTAGSSRNLAIPALLQLSLGFIGFRTLGFGGIWDLGFRDLGFGDLRVKGSGFWDVGFTRIINVFGG